MQVPDVVARNVFSIFVYEPQFQGVAVHVSLELPAELVEVIERQADRAGRHDGHVHKADLHAQNGLTNVNIDSKIVSIFAHRINRHHFHVQAKNPPGNTIGKADSAMNRVRKYVAKNA